jgi:hypothetical protein
LRRANLQGADLQGAILQEATLGRANLYTIQNVYRAHALETINLRLYHTSDTEDALYFETCQRPWPERWLDWERLRVVGRLPLFGASGGVPR